MKIALAQINPTVGDLKGNAHKIIQHVQKLNEQVDLVLFPELSLLGYPPKDLLLRKDFIDESLEILGQEIAPQIETPTLIGIVSKSWNTERLHNSVAFIHKGRIQQVFNKKLLPNYEVFNESRYFQPGKVENLNDFVFEINGKKIGVLICEDLLGAEINFAHYGFNPLDYLAKKTDLDLAVCLSASPFRQEKIQKRIQLARLAWEKLKCPIALVNQIGANDDLIFDGSSFVLDKNGELISQAKSFQEEILVCETTKQIPPSPLIRGNKIENVDAEALNRYGTFNYNTELLDRAKTLRENPTPTEQRIWDEVLRSKQLLGYKFTRQKPIGNYILDFYCAELLFAIEIDGEIHNQNKEYDQVRTNYLNGCGIQVIRFNNIEVLDSIEHLKGELIKTIEVQKSKLQAPPYKGVGGYSPETKQALVLGIQDYFHKAGFKKAFIGISGGVDSALVAALAVEALGSENVTGIMMPSIYSSGGSLSDGQELINNLSIQSQTISIQTILESYLQGGVIQKLTLAEENLQARIRGNILMGLSGREGGLVLATGNKSEFAVGYSTLYGDMCGALAPIGDLWKTQVWKLAALFTEIPGQIIDKPPSAELKPNQLDIDSLPDYVLLDAILIDYIEYGLSAKEIEKKGFERSLVEKTIAMLHKAEFKRKQAPIILKISNVAFGSGWIQAIAKK